MRWFPTMKKWTQSARRLRPRCLACETLEARTVLAHASVPDAQPNFVFILSDDQDVGTMQYMPRVQERLGNQGVTFENMFVTNPICCPSNVSILTGQYSHNTQILHNRPPLGGFQKFVDMRTDGNPATLGDETTLATWLRDAGYLTGRVGKYLVGYPENSTYIPPGWDDWFGTYGGGPGYYNYGVNDNGTVVRFGDQPEDYSTDVLTNHVITFLDRAELNDAQPFFAFFAPSTPHVQGIPNGAPIPAPRHLGMFAGATAPRPPSFNEADVSDKPPHVRNLPLLTDEQIAALDREYQARLESLQALDEGVERIIDALAARGELDNTYIVFTSDNGYHLGQHRLFTPFGPFPRAGGKGEAYEEDIRVPLMVRGPGVQAGVALDHLVLNTDFAPTITALAGVSAGRVMDGQSLVSLLKHDTPPSNWRNDFLVEIYRAPMESASPGLALRTQYETYVEYTDGFRELYDLRTDPYQLENIYATADPEHLAVLSQRLAELAVSHGDPPTIESVVVNDDSAQRSMVNSLTITFDRVVSFDPGAFGLVGEGGNDVGLDVSESVVDGRTVAVLTFTGSDIIGSSLADGNYKLTIRGDHIRDEAGRELDADADGNGGGQRVDEFFRLYGDSDGDADVDHDDLDVMLSTFGNDEGQAGYLWYFDFDGDGDVDGLDMAQFNHRRRS